MDKSIETSYVIHLIKLLAYAITTEKSVSGNKIDFFNQFIQENYPKEIEDTLFAELVNRLQNPPSLNSILEEISKEYGKNYQKKLELIVRFYELLGSDGLNKSDQELFIQISKHIGIEEKDIDLIHSLLLNDYIFKFSENLNRKVSFGNDPNLFDLIYDGLDMEIFEAEGLFYIINRKSDKRLYVDDKRVHRNRIVSLTAKKFIQFGDDEILIDDIQIFFQLKRDYFKNDFFFEYKFNKLIKVDKFEKAHIKIEANQNILKIYKNPDKPLNLQINDTEVADFSYVNIRDSVILDHQYKIPIREILIHHSNSSFTLEEYTPEKDGLIISNNPDFADIYVKTESDQDLSIPVKLVKERNYTQFTIFVSQLPTKATINGKELKINELIQITSDTRILIEKNLILFECDSGKIITSIIHFNSFEVEELFYKHANGDIGIDHVSFNLENGEMVGIMGSSGAGKTTLLQLMLGYLKPDSGQVKINNKDFYQNFDKIKSHIGYVPQDDLLMPNLTAFQNLFFAAKIRLPHLKKREIIEKVDSVLKELGLLDKKNLKVGSPVNKILSGGQRKRLNIGMELLSDPDLFFLDEPTSGLSSKDSEIIINYLSSLAKKGKIVFIIIHQPSSIIYKSFDKILVLDNGGKLAYFGKSLDALRYFKTFLSKTEEFIECPSCGNVNPEVIFDVVLEKEVDRDGLPIYEIKHETNKGIFGFLLKKFNIQKTVISPKRRYTSDYWKKLFMSKMALQKKHDHLDKSERDKFFDLPPKPKRNIFTKIKMIYANFQRTFQEKVHDTSNIFMTFAAPVGLGLLLSFMMRGAKTPYQLYTNPEYTKFLFLTVIIFVFFGLMPSITQVLKDKPIIMREKIVNLKPWHYVFSKITVFSIFSIIQVLIYSIIGFITLKIPLNTPPGFMEITQFNPGFFLYFIIMCFVLAYVAYSTGLFISSLLSSEMGGFYMIVILIVIQIVFGGMFLEYDSMVKLPFENNSKAEVPSYCNISFSRWAYEGLIAGNEAYNPIYFLQTLPYKDFTERNNRNQQFQRLRNTVYNQVPEKITKSDFEKRIEDPLNEKIDDYINDYQELKRLDYLTNMISIETDKGRFRIPESEIFDDILYYEELDNKYTVDNSVTFNSITSDSLEIFKFVYETNEQIMNAEVSLHQLNDILQKLIENYFYYTQINDFYTYHRDLDRKYYHIYSEEYAKHNKQQILKIFKQIHFNTIYDDYRLNENIEEMLAGTDEYSFPNRRKKIYGYTVSTPYFNLTVLFIIGLVLNIFTLIKLKRI